MSRLTGRTPKELPAPYEAEILVRFADCDPAQIVFYPQYLVMFNDLVEDWFEHALDLGFPKLHSRGWGLPTVHLEVDFKAPSRMGDLLAATLAVNRVGTSSINLDIVMRGQDGKDRVRGNVVLVLTDRHKHRAIPIADEMKQRLLQFRTA